VKILAITIARTRIFTPLLILRNPLKDSHLVRKGANILYLMYKAVVKRFI